MPLLHAGAYLDNAYHYCISCGSQMDKAVGDISLPLAYIAPFNVMEASQQGGGFLGRTNLISPCAVNTVCSAFNSRVLLSSSSGK